MRERGANNVSLDARTMEEPYMEAGLFDVLCCIGKRWSSIDFGGTNFIAMRGQNNDYLNRHPCPRLRWEGAKSP